MVRRTRFVRCVWGALSRGHCPVEIVPWRSSGGDRPVELVPWTLSRGHCPVEIVLLASVGCVQIPTNMWAAWTQTNVNLNMFCQ